MSFLDKINIDFIRAFFLLFVVYIHAYEGVTNYLGYDFFLYKNFHFNYINPAAILAGLSGFLYFKNNTFDTIYSKYYNRIRSILRPLLFWTIFFWLLYVGLAFFSRVLHIGYLFSFTKQGDFTAGNLFKIILLPVNHLWYLHDLVILMILSPLLFNRKIRIILLLLIPLVYSEFLSFELFLKYRFVFFYILGSHFAIEGENYDFKKDILLFLLLIAISLGMLNRSYLYSDIFTILFFGVFLLLQGMIIRSINFHHDRKSHFLLYILHPLIVSVLLKLIFSFSIRINLDSLPIKILYASSITFGFVYLTTVVSNTIMWILKKYFIHFSRFIL